VLGNLRTPVGRVAVEQLRLRDAVQPLSRSDLTVLVLSRGGIVPGTQLRTFEAFNGIAADGVKRVGVIDAQDRLVPMADVMGNAFSADAPSDRIKAIVALDEKGEVIWQSAPVPLPDE
jgi:hypothetical protein